MSSSSPAIDWRGVQRLAQEEARRLCRRLGLSAQDRDDFCQDLLVDLLARLPAYDPAKGEPGAFARVCLRHAALRIATQQARRRRSAQAVSLDDPLPGAEGLTLSDVLGDADSFAAWLGQPVNPIAELERRLDLERAAAAIPADDHPLCQALARGEPHPARQAGLSRTTAFRRLQELRLRLLAAGIPAAA
jgi:RNA polymerase sigma-70 factor (ECF subfamily)